MKYLVFAVLIALGSHAFAQLQPKRGANCDEVAQILQISVDRMRTMQDAARRACMNNQEGAHCYSMQRRFYPQLLALAKTLALTMMDLLEPECTLTFTTKVEKHT